MLEEEDGQRPSTSLREEARSNCEQANVFAFCWLLCPQLPGGSTLERIQQIELEISRTQKNKALAADINNLENTENTFLLKKCWILLGLGSCVFQFQNVLECFRYVPTGQ